MTDAANKTVRLWDVATGQQIASQIIPDLLTKIFSTPRNVACYGSEVLMPLGRLRIVALLVPLACGSCSSSSQRADGQSEEPRTSTAVSSSSTAPAITESASVSPASPATATASAPSATTPAEQTLASFGWIERPSGVGGLGSPTEAIDWRARVYSGADGENLTLEVCRGKASRRRVHCGVLAKRLVLEQSAVRQINEMLAAVTSANKRCTSANTGPTIAGSSPTRSSGSSPSRHSHCQANLASQRTGW